MITAQLGPPTTVAAAGRRDEGPDPAGGDATGAPEAFVALLAQLVDPAPPPLAPPSLTNAAGPQLGELLTDTGADAADVTSATPTPVADAGTLGAQRAPASMSLVAPAAFVSMPSPAATAPSGSVQAVATPASSAAQTAPATTVVAVAASSVDPVTEAPVAPTAMPVATAAASAPAPAAATGGVLGSPEPPADGPAALVTMTLSRPGDGPPAAGREAIARSSGGEQPAAGPRGEVAPPAAIVTPPAPPPAATTASTATAPLARATNAAELAHELGARMRMAVREGGRELVVSLRPAELGQLTVRVTVVDGALTAQIAADRPEAARMLQQSLGQLNAVLAELGFQLDSLDIAWNGGENPTGGEPGRRDGADEEAAPGFTLDGPPPTVPSAAATGGTPAPAADGLDLLV